MAETPTSTQRSAAAADSADDDTQLKKRARRRLVGATALALLAIIVLPMVMDQEPKPATQDIQIRIPSQDAPNLASRLMPAKPAATPMPPIEPQPAQPAAKTEPAAATPPAAKPEAQPQPKQAEAPPAKPAGSAADKPAEKPVAKAAEKKGDEARAKAILDGGNGGQWVLQMGAYQEMGNVKLLQAKIKELGYSSYTEKVETAQGQRIRVRAGPFASRQAAEKAQARLRKIGAGGPPGGAIAQK